jgi:hypothetical protein
MWAWGLRRHVTVDVLEHNQFIVDGLRRKFKPPCQVVLCWARRGVVSQDLVRESPAGRCEGLMATHRSHRHAHRLTRPTK